MPMVTYHVALPFSAGDDGELLAGEPQEAKNPSHAVFKARGLAASQGGAIAFSRTGDDTTGDYQDAVVHGRFGAVPDYLAGFVGR